MGAEAPTAGVEAPTAAVEARAAGVEALTAEERTREIALQPLLVRKSGLIDRLSPREPAKRFALEGFADSFDSLKFESKLSHGISY